LKRRVTTANGLAIAGALVWSLLMAAPAISQASFHFLPAEQVAGPPFASHHALEAMACPNAKLCLVGDDSGNVVSSTSPTGGSAAWSVGQQIDPPGRTAGIACPSKSLCVAVGADGNIAHSTNPGKASSWNLVTGVVSQANGFTGVACHGTKFCVALDGRGDVLISRQPTGGARTWKLTRVITKKQDWLVSIACPTASECVAVDRFGHTVAHSIKPTGGRRAWHLTTIGTQSSSHSHDTIACASRSLCAITGLESGALRPMIATSTKPTGPPKAWNVSRRLPTSFTDPTGISCPSVRLCLASSGNSSPAIYSTHPSGGAKTFRAAAKTNFPGANGVACASASLCAEFSGTGQIEVSSAPTSSATSAWVLTTVDGYNPLAAVACAGPNVCLAGGAQQKVFATANPAGPASAWSAQPITIAPEHLACVSPTLCVAGDGTSGDVAATATPLTGGWNVADTNSDLPDGGNIAVLACASGPFCLAGPYEVQSDSDFEGTTSLTSTNPTGGTGAWAYDSTAIEGGVNGGGRAAKGTVRSLACPAATLCVAGDARGGLLVSMAPTQQLSWKYSRPDGTASINGLSCPTTALCVGVDSQGRALSTTNPKGGTWKRVTIDAGLPLTAVSCASSSFCVAVDGHRHAFVSTNPTGGTGSWRPLTGIDGDLAAISCPSSSLCVAVDTQGNAAVGQS
jgi:hypothetical protein